ncbi:SNARE associated Golgi protein [bacterium BMS3Bbin06]|nr:SNARE associated Golgi protein [bacterium BMS3Abin08]GBE34081.1 SNARE associated Golgi protein [bacterium BMS3Bbin06]
MRIDRKALLRLSSPYGRVNPVTGREVRFLRRLYNWVLHWADTPYGVPALFMLSFAEASFFPVPPDVLLIVLALSRNKRAFYFSFICTVGSVLGGILGFFIGMNFWAFGKEVLFHYISVETFNQVRRYFLEYEAWAITVAGFTPIPYKVFTISAGFFRVDFMVFVIASALSRGARFFLIGGLIYLFGEHIRNFIDRYFNLLTYLFLILLIGGFFLLKHLL